jgi:3-deoxy-D-manno-octulosonic-acid transferase
MLGWLLNAVYILGLTLLSPVLAYKAATTGKYRTGLWAKFFGAAPTVNDPRPVVWLHAVSVGEVLLLKPLLARLARELPDYRLVLSTTTNAGLAVAREKYPHLPAFFAPLDFTWAVGRVFAQLQPKLLVLTELDLWPNLLLTAKRRGVPVAVVNARMGERSFGGYRRILPIVRPALAAIRWWGAQTDPMAERIRTLTAGLDARIAVSGSLKYDGAPTDRQNSRTRALRELLGLTPRDRVWVAGSTQGSEERIVLDVFQRLRATHRGLKLIVVPRHPERFGEVEKLLSEAGMDFRKRSQIVQPLAETPTVTLVDTVGELAAVWGLADVGFVGGSLGCGRGGQSMIEPAGYGVPVCFGPEVWNFQETADRLMDAKAALRVSDADQLFAALAHWLDDPAAANVAGDNARRFIASQLGAVAVSADALVRLLPPRAALRYSA